MELILLGDLNVRLREPRDAREEDLETTLAESGVFGMTSHFVARRWYREAGSWTW